MAKKNEGDLLTCDWNPVVGCRRYSAGCRKCWFLDGILPWQQRLGNLPADFSGDHPLVMEKRMNEKSLQSKNGIVGVVQHGDFFWDQIDDRTIGRVLYIVDAVAREKARKGKATKYVLWSKRAGRMADFLAAHYPRGVPPYLACGVSVEDQKSADERLPHLLRIQGHRFVMIEPMLGPVDLGNYLNVNWVVLGSETGKAGGLLSQSLDADWARAVRDQVVPRGIPFFIKQLGSNHKKPQRVLDGRTWDQFPVGFEK